MVLPAPVGPTIATVCPGSTVSERSSMSGFSGSYRKDTCSRRTRPRSSAGRSPGTGSASCSSASRSSKIRSAEATPDCTRFAIDATCVSGIENCREYWMKAWTSPMDSAPDATRRPPTTATST